ncbi:hypothetical protein GCM10010145_68030 [Streptomyces ruber]|uniref:Uncharacterized protein n=2 Tax=Streptomyces TaxID=1883 RepID=A0A918F0A4_9ACTN|nr:hypothetical protein GCM10010145_68030 [Streptomyces ruber]
MFLAALLTPLPCQVLRRLQLLVRPDTVPRGHRDLMERRRVPVPVPPGRQSELRGRGIVRQNVVPQNAAVSVPKRRSAFGSALVSITLSSPMAARVVKLVPPS